MTQSPAALRAALLTTVLAVFALVFLATVAVAATAGAAAVPAQQEEPADPEEDRESAEAEPPSSRYVHEEHVVISANRYSVPSRHVGSTVTVLDAEEIARRHKATVAELLRTVPGVEITRSGGPGKATIARLRGGESNHTLVLLDGVRLNNANNDGDFDFSNLSTDLIERIEILRGPQATYGSAAMAGVISITTRRGTEELDLSAAVEAGTLDHQRLLFSLSGASGALDYSLAGSDLSTGGISHTSERLGNDEEDPYDNRTLSGRLGFPIAGDGRFDLSTRYFEGETALDGFFGDDPNASQTTEGLATGIEVQTDLAGFWRQSFRLGFTSSDLLGEDPDTLFNNYDIRSRATELFVQSDITLADSDVLSFGLGFERREAENRGAFDQAADLRSAFVQNQWSLEDRLHVTAALRNDDYSAGDDETTWRVTLAWLPGNGGTRLHTSLGTAFRVPGFNELYFPFAGNLELQPETSTGFDAGVEQRFFGGRLLVDLTWFANDFDDLIVFDLGTFTFQNVQRASSDGLEATLILEAATGYAIELSHTYNRTEDLASGQPLARRPRSRSSLVLSFDPLPALRGDLTVLSVRDRIDSTGLPMDDYERVDLSFETRAFSWLRPYVRIENLLDEDYEEVTGFTSPGFFAAFGLSVSSR